MYDGYNKYGADEAAGYEEARKKEPLWWLEEQFVVDYLAEHQPKKILDAPVGTGRFLPHYRTTQEAVGTDISEQMLAESARKLGDPNLAHVKLLLGDIFKLDFPTNHFDLTLCWRFAHLVPAELLADALRELGRVTGGEILLQTYIGRPYWARLTSSLLRLPGKLIRRLSGNPPPPLPWSHIRAYFHTHETIAIKSAQAGLVIQQRIEIGRYDDSQVYVYRLTKAKQHRET
ncbi:MAG: class I SAM-dependent methyltransferase [Dechloromonas sp.]|nr:class I SAM-dependent methyltransferase [Dechloromonas sp.]